MSWDRLLGEDDLGLYRRNISLLEEQVSARFTHGHEDPAILAAIRAVPRHFYVDGGYRLLAYTDNALPTHGGLTTSAPSVIAEMIFHSGASRGSRVLEVGTGTGYEASVLSELGARVFSVEIDGPLAERARAILGALGYPLTDSPQAGAPGDRERLRRQRELVRLFAHRGRIDLVRGNGERGLPACAPFDAIIVAAAVPHRSSIRELSRQLSTDGGRLVVPVGPPHDQKLHIVERRGSRITVAPLEGLTFDFVRLVQSNERPRSSVLGR